MISFLICVDRAWLITAIKWSNPAYLVPLNTSLLELFSEMDKAIFSEIVKSDMRKEFSYCPIGLRLKDHSAKVNLCSVPIDDLYLVFGFDQNLFSYQYSGEAVQALIYKFMYVVKESLQDNFILNTKTAKLHFEKMQALNNELVNTRRMLEKANAKLTIVNKDLNNRLVKDALTGLVSRYQYRTEIEQCIAANPGKLGVFTFIDVDRFKAINDTYGHGAGDRYLIEFAERLKKLPIANTIKLRISGDEFGLFTCNMERADFHDMEEIWNQIKNHVLHKPITIDDLQLPLSISAGMAVYGVDTREIYDLIEYADFAMYNAKRNGKNQFKVFNQAEYEAMLAAKKSKNGANGSDLAPAKSL